MIGLGRLYAVEFHAVAVSAQQDLFYIKPAADKICVDRVVYVAASGGNADAGDAQEELFDIELIYLPATVTVGSGGGAFTPVPKSSTTPPPASPPGSTTRRSRRRRAPRQP
jgi:hypothetical protein